jgi:tetratricopeptide (TPR) repeat protein
MALNHYRDLDHQAGLARALNAVGWYCSHLGNPGEAITYCEQALLIHQEIGNLVGQAATWDSLGHAHTQLGHHRHAISCYRQSLELLGDDERTYQCASVLGELGSTYLASGDYAAAEGTWRHAKAILDELYHPDADKMQTSLRELKAIQQRALIPGNHLPRS